MNPPEPINIKCLWYLRESMVNVETLERLRKACGIGSILALIMVVFAAVSVIVYAMEIVLGLTDPGFAMDPMDNRGTVINAISNLAGMLACLWATLYGFHLVKSISEGDSPFTPGNVSCMKGIATTLLAAFVAMILIQTLLILALHPEMYLFDVPTHILVAGAVSYLIYLIFEYGTALQTESDEFL